MAVLLAVAATPATASVTRAQAQKKALTALGVKKSSAPVIVFRLSAPLAARTRITEAGALTARKQRPRPAGVRRFKAPLVATLGGEKAWFFYADRAPFKAYEHPGQVVLVGVKTGKVLKTRALRWPPLVSGRLPAFLRSAKAYRAKANRIFYRPGSATARRAAAPRSGVFGPLAGPSLARSAATQRVADVLAAQHTCAVSISDTLGDFYDFGNIDPTRAGLDAILNDLAAFNPGFQVLRYSTSSKRAPTAFVANAIATRGCKQLLLYVAGGGVKSKGATSTAVVGTAPRKGGMLDTQSLGSGQLEQLVRQNPGVAFSVIVDAPFAGGFVSALGDEPNVSLVMSPLAGRGFAPELQQRGMLLPNAGNAVGLLEFTNRLLTGLDRFYGDPAEVETAANQTAAGFIAWMFARAFLGPAVPGTPGDVPPGDTPPVDVPPTAVDDAKTVTEDDAAAAVDVLANDTDTDGGPKTVASVTQPSHGVTAITGDGTGVTYSPAANYCNDGGPTDDFTYTLNGGSTAKVAVTVTCVDDPGTAVADVKTVTEGDSATTIDVLANDADPDGNSINLVSQPVHGTVAITNAGADLTYAPNSNYCNNGSPTDDFTYTVAGGSTATVAVTVTCVGDPPVAVDDVSTAGEDSGANSVDVLANDTDTDGGAKLVAQVTQPANGTVVITNAGADLTYTPNADYCNSPPGPITDDFTYTLNGGSSATVAMTVTCADDGPAGVNDTATVAEDSSATTVDVLANDTDIDGGPKSISLVTQPSGGTVVITNAGADLTYMPNADYCNSPPGTTTDDFTYTLAPGGSTATVSMTVTCSADPPVVSTSGTLSYTENDPATPIDPAITVTDPDRGGTITGATVQITSNYAGAEDLLALANPLTHSPITAMQVGDTLTLSGSGSPADYQSALADVTYSNSSDSPSTLLRTVTFTVTDDTALSASDSRDIQVTAADDGPVAVDDSATVSEDSGATAVDVLANDTDADGGSISIDSAGDPANGTVVITGGGTGLTYQPDAAYCNDPPGGAPDSFTYTLAPGGSTATVSMTVSCAADPPMVTTSGGSLSYTENDAATPIDSGVTATDPDADATITGATVQITSNYAGAEDVLALANPLTHSPITAMQVGDTLTLSGSASPAAYQSALRDVTYVNTSEAPSELTRTVTFTVTDDTALSGSDTRDIEVAAFNDPPTAVDDTGTTDEDTPLSVSAPGVLANDTDVDPGDTKAVVALNGSATLTGSSAEGGTVAINADGSYTYTPPAAFQSMATGDSDTDSFQYTMEDGAGAQSTATVNLTVDGVSDAPSAVSDSYDVVGNTSLFAGTTRPASQAGKEISGSLLDNDTDPDTPSGSLVVEPVTDASTALGGTITIESDGNFTYQPNDGDVGVTDSFTYRVCDASPCNSGTVANSTGTVSFPITGQVWYVRNNEPAGGDGTSDTPFDTLAEAEAASGTGDTVYVFDGNNTSSNLDTGFAMGSNERLIGESRPLSLDPDGGGGLPTADLFPGTFGAQPTLTGSNEDVIALASGALVDGIDVDPSGAGGGISGGAGTSNVTIAHVNVTDTGTLGTQPGLELDGTTGTNNVSDFTVTNGGSATAIGVRINNAGTVNFASAGTVSITTSGAKGLDASGTGLGAGSVFDDITVTGSASGGVSMVSTTGTTTFSNLALTTSSGATGAFVLNGAGNVTVADAGTANISATGGPAVSVSGTSGATLPFDDVDSTNSAGTGVSISGLGAGTFSANSSSLITNATGIDFDLDGGTAAVTYDGAITDNTGLLVRVQNTSGGTKDFNGSISGVAGAAGGNVALSSNSGATIRFDGGLTLATAGATPALSATGGGTLAVTDPAGSASNKLGTAVSTGVGLNVVNTSISDDDLTFESISSSGAANGIVLNNTSNANGSLVVTGNGGSCTSAASCTGGAIQTSAGAGVSLTSVPGGVSLTRMSVNNGAGDGIGATSVAGLAVDSSSIKNNGNAANEDGIGLSQATGTIAITNTDASGSGYNNFSLQNTSGTVSSLSLTNSKFNANSQTTGNHGALVDIGGTSQLTTASVSGSEFKDNFSIGLQVVAGGSASIGTFTVNNNTFTGTSTGATTGTQEIAVDVEKSGTSNLTAAITNNLGIVGHNSHAINLFTAAGAGTTGGTFKVRVTGNTIGSSGSASSGSQIGNCIRTNLNGDSTNTVLIGNNTLRQCPNGRGIEVIGRNGTGTSDVTVTNNDVNPQAPAAPLAAIVVQSNCVTICATVRADVRGNVVPAASDATDFFTTYLELVESGASTLQLVNTSAAGTCTQQLTNTNTGSAQASAGCALIAGPINTPP